MENKTPDYTPFGFNETTGTIHPNYQTDDTPSHLVGGTRFVASKDEDGRLYKINEETGEREYL